MPHSKTVLEKMEALRREYRDQLPFRLDEIDAAWAKVLENKREAKAWLEFYRLVHVLAGSGATFGFARLGQIAAVLEKTIMPHLGGNGTTPPPVPRIKALLAELKKAGEPEAPPVYAFGDGDNNPSQ